MKKIKTVLMMMMMVLLPTSCRSEKVLTIDENSPRTEKYYNLSSFKAIQASSGIKVVYKQNENKQKVKVDAVKKILPYLVVKTSGDALVVSIDTQKAGSVRIKGTPVIVYVSTPEMERLTASSGSRIEVKTDLRTDDDLSLETSSGGSVSLNNVWADNVSATLSSGSSLRVNDLSTDDLSVTTSSGSSASLNNVSCVKASVTTSSGASVSMSGACRGRVSYAVSSGASAKAADFKAVNVSASASSGASLKCYATKCLEAEASSGGSIRYKGDPKKLNVSKKGVRPM